MALLPTYYILFCLSAHLLYLRCRSLRRSLSSWIGQLIRIYARAMRRLRARQTPRAAFLDRRVLGIIYLYINFDSHDVSVETIHPASRSVRGFRFIASTLWIFLEHLYLQTTCSLFYWITSIGTQVTTLCETYQDNVRRWLSQTMNQGTLENLTVGEARRNKKRKATMRAHGQRRGMAYDIGEWLG